MINSLLLSSLKYTTRCFGQKQHVFFKSRHVSTKSYEEVRSKIVHLDEHLDMHRSFSCSEMTHNLAALPRILRKFFGEPISKIVLTDGHITSYNKQGGQIYKQTMIGPPYESFILMLNRFPFLKEIMVKSKANPNVYNIKYK
ncbi:hypothetical protein HOG98_03030 [bacterium]|jgi:hypothetical protein|nr:hypothetical protein [bacterium]